jgi:hypothetical protein
VKPLTESDIRGAFVNATKGEVGRMPLPGLHEVIWDSREYLGWRDAQAPQRGYLVHWDGDVAVGIFLRASETTLRSGITAMCSLCRTPQPSDQVTLFSAPRAGEAGRDGNTVGTYICSDLACSHIIRILPPKQPMQPEPEQIVAARAVGLLERVQGFTANVRRAI